MRFFTTTTPAGRLEYLAVMIAVYATAIAGAVLIVQVDVQPALRDVSYQRTSLATFAFLFVAVYGIAIINMLRRMKDLHMGSGWVILGFVPLVNVFFHLMLLFSKGVKRQTFAPYGDDPYNPDSWVQKPATSRAGAPAVTFKGQALLLPGEAGWDAKEEAA